MPEPFYFVSSLSRGRRRLRAKLGDQLTAGPPSIGVWLDRRQLQPGIDWDEQLVEALARISHREGCIGPRNLR